MTNLLTKQQVAERVGWHPEHVMREARAGRFEKRVRESTSAHAGDVS